MCRINVFSFVGIKHRKSHQVLEKDSVPNFVLGVQLGHLQTEQVQKKISDHMFMDLILI